MDLYQPQGVGRKKRSIPGISKFPNILDESAFIKNIIHPVRSKRSDGYDRDRQRSVSITNKGKGEAIFMRKDKIITEKPRRNFYPIPLNTYSEKRENDRHLDTDKNNHQEADINENVSFTVIIPEGNVAQPKYFRYYLSW